MNVGVIGIGVMGKNHVRVYSELKEVDEIYVYDLNINNTNKIKNYAVVCNSIDEVLRSVEAVSICVPTKDHFSVAKKAIERGIHCLIEKPITLTIEEGEKILDLLKNRDLVVGVGHIERFNPIIDEITRIIDRPMYIEIKRHNPSSIRITDSSVVEDLMIHDIDIVFNVIFNGKQYNEIYSAGTIDVCKSMIVFDDSVVALSASRMASKKIRTVYIEDKEFTIEGDFMNQEVYIYRKPERYGMENERYMQENIIEKVLVNKVEPLKVELKTFIKCVKRGREFPVTPEQALNNLRICEIIRRGLK